jgi:glycerophosphoryl diester phosphodiesterase
VNTSSNTIPARFDLQGHRGCRGLLPENTLPAFERALAIGVHTLELDLGVTRDGHVVICHDRALNPEITRDTNGQWLAAPVLVSSLSLAQIQSHDVGRINPASEYAKRFATQQPIDGTRMPTLDELFTRVKALGAAHVHFNVETKISPEKPQDTVSPETFVAAVLAVVRAHKLQARVIVQSFDWRTLALVQQQEPRVRTACLTAQQPWTDNITPRPGQGRWTGQVRSEDHADVPSAVAAAGSKIWSPYFGDLSSALVKKSHTLGLQVVPWTVNEPEHMQAVIDLGVDGLITDYPDRARNILASHSYPLAPTLGA